MLSEAFFRKRWPREELDALFALEGDGQTRILPVWVGVGEADVRRYSPMMASRVAVIHHGGAEATVNDLDRSMARILLNAGLDSAVLRKQTRESLAWVNPPALYEQSLRLFDRLKATDDISDLPAPISVSLGDLIARAPAFDGKMIATVGHQTTSQLLLTYTPYEIVKYVLQVRSGDPSQAHAVCYVRCWGYDVLELVHD